MGPIELLLHDHAPGGVIPLHELLDAFATRRRVIASAGVSECRSIDEFDAMRAVGRLDSSEDDVLCPLHLTALPSQGDQQFTAEALEV